ncbi:RloB domain-containing protein [Paraburkholderia xenovorans]|uniref:RloB domain-containing protein n=1 Tax=Paraburkholderia xenovorans TaxID=36873 RepID=UPI0038BCCF6B
MSGSRRNRIPQRKRIFIGCEGESERSYTALLQQLLGSHAEFHLVAEVLNGGDPLALLESAEKALRRDRALARDPFFQRFVILDSDLRGRSAHRDELCLRIARNLGIHLIWQDPCHEAVLLRHLLDCERRRPPTSRESEEQLRAVWPTYVKNFGRDRLSERIDVAALLRVHREEPELAILLRLIKLVE